MEKGMVSVDRWAKGSQVYFLTHLHADHTSGLSPTWTYGSLFCSRITAKLIPFKFPGFKLSLLRVLEIGRWQVFNLVSPSTGEQTRAEVIAIDANHCPGSVMYLFRGEFGCILYTGDFRWETASKRSQVGRVMLHKALRNEKVDTLILDNTYCNPSYKFPSREVAAQQVLSIITSHPEHDIIIGIDTLGKEELLIYIARVLNIKIWVWPERLRTMHLLGFSDIFTTKTSLTRVRAVPRYSFSIETLEGLNAVRPTIGIMPSGLPWAVKTAEGNVKNFAVTSTPSQNVKSIQKFHQYIYTVTYSDHSCFTEIEEFVKLLRPDQIKGIVTSSPSYVDPLYYLGDLCATIQPSLRLYQKFEIKEKGTRLDAKTESIHGNRRMSKGKGDKRIMRDHLGVRKSRVSLLRRSRSGAKLVGFQHTDH